MGFTLTPSLSTTTCPTLVSGSCKLSTLLPPALVPRGTGSDYTFFMHFVHNLMPYLLTTSQRGLPPPMLQSRYRMDFAFSIGMFLSLARRAPEVRCLLQVHQPHAVCLQETWHKFPADLPHFEGYTLASECHRHHHKGGGSVIFIASALVHHFDAILDGHIEYCSGPLRYRGCKVHLHNIYVPPPASAVSPTPDQLRDSLLHHVPHLGPHGLLFGDTNAFAVDPREDAQRDWAEAAGAMQLQWDTPTSLRGDGNNFPDVGFASEDLYDMIATEVLATGTSDHRALLQHVGHQIPPHGFRLPRRWRFDHAQLPVYQQALLDSLLPWDDYIALGPLIAYDDLTKSILAAAHKAFSSLRRLRLGKAPGFDGIIPEFLRYFPLVSCVLHHDPLQHLDDHRVLPFIMAPFWSGSVAETL